MALDVFDSIGAGLALAELATAQAIGKYVSYRSAGSAAVFIWVVPARMEDVSQGVVGTRAQEYARTFWIAAQVASDGSQWPAPIGGIRVSDVITFEDRAYQVMSWSDLGTNSGSKTYSDLPRGVYRIETIQDVAKQVGDVD